MGNEFVVKWNRGRQGFLGVSNQRMHYIDVQNCPRTNLIIKISHNLGHIVLFFNTGISLSLLFPREEEIISASLIGESFLWLWDSGVQ